MTNLKRKARAWDQLQHQIAHRELKIVRPYTTSTFDNTLFPTTYEGCSGHQQFEMYHALYIKQQQIEGLMRERDALLRHAVDAMRMSLPASFIVKEKL